MLGIGGDILEDEVDEPAEQLGIGQGEPEHVGDDGTGMCCA